MKATDEQIVQLRSIPDTCKCTDCRKQREALAAVLAELATLREENKPLRELRDAVKRLDDQLQRGDMATLWKTEVKPALAKCQQSTHPANQVTE